MIYIKGDLRPLVNEIIRTAQAVMYEMGEMMESYEWEDYADKIRALDDLWLAIDKYLETTGEGDNDEMEDLGLS